MVSPFTLGLFAPLPLAMMIPFMATQSLAMGEAFGKSFQYGKRKISSLTNEEFNKLTFNDLMDQQTANIKSIIPTLHTQMIDSNQMQQDIFREMTKLIPAFIDGLTKGTKDIFTDPTKTGQITPTQATADKINASSPDIQPLIDGMALMFKNLSNAFPNVPSAYGSNELVPEITNTPSQNINPPPTNTFQNIQDIQKQIDSGRLQTPEQLAEQQRLDRLKFKTQPTAGGIRRNQIAESGLSPVAFAAREKFRSNIDAQVRLVDTVVKNKSFNIANNGGIARTPKSVIAALDSKINLAVLKLSKLRIKYQQVYGHQY